MPTPHVSKGVRVYLTGRKSFGEVLKTSLLGTEAVVVECDDGSLRAICGERVLDEVVDKSTLKNGRGIQKTVPTDVKVIGPAVMQTFGVDEQTRAALFQKFIVLDEKVKSEKATYWEQNRDDPAAMSTFLPELMSLLGDDTLFVKAKAARLLNHLDQDTRDVMLANMMSSTTPEERKTMITEFTSIQNDRRKVAVFLQDMYELLLDNKTYIKMEFKKSLATRRIVGHPMIATFFANASESQLDNVVNVWRKRKYYRSRRGCRYALNILKKYS